MSDGSTNNALRSDLPPLPPRVKRLPIDPQRKVPVPWFVAWVDGKPDFRVIAPGKLVAAVQKRKCWVCGEPLGRYLSFVLGPMCAITRTTSEPACHHDCAVFAATACPFLTKPYMKRSVGEKPEGVTDPAGIHLDRNPGCVAVWTCASFGIFKPYGGAPGILFKVHEPSTVEWFAEGRAATRAEVDASIAGGMPFLMNMAETDGDEAIKDLKSRVEIAAKFLPAAVSPL